MINQIGIGRSDSDKSQANMVGTATGPSTSVVRKNLGTVDHNIDGKLEQSSERYVLSPSTILNTIGTNLYIEEWHRSLR